MRTSLSVLLSLTVGFTCMACSPMTQAATGMSADDHIAKLKTDNGILERALDRCKDQLPPENSWPRMYSTGSFGDFWITSEMHGKVFNLRPHYADHEEQLFILARSGGNQEVKIEGAGLRKVDSGTIYAIFVYVPPKDDEERKKLQKITISYEDYKFVMLFKPSRY